MTKTLALMALTLSFAWAATLAFADDSCSAQATAKKLSGAAKTSFNTVAAPLVRARQRD